MVGAEASESARRRHRLPGWWRRTRWPSHGATNGPAGKVWTFWFLAAGADVAWVGGCFAKEAMKPSSVLADWWCVAPPLPTRMSRLRVMALVRGIPSDGLTHSFPSCGSGRPFRAERSAWVGQLAGGCGAPAVGDAGERQGGGAPSRVDLKTLFRESLPHAGIHMMINCRHFPPRRCAEHG
jgi:hypothetical protein